MLNQDKIQTSQEEIKKRKQREERFLLLGRVESLDEKLHRVRVSLPDRDNMITGWLPVITLFSYGDAAYALPQKGDTVLCVFFKHGLEDGFVIGSIYTKKHEPPLKNKNLNYIVWEDGTRVIYNKETRTLTIYSAEKINIVADKEINISAPCVKVNKLCSCCACH